MSNPEQLYGLDEDVAWPEGVEPKNWREEDDPDNSDNDDDDWEPTPDYVEAILGFDPDELED